MKVRVTKHTVASLFHGQGSLLAVKAHVDEVVNVGHSV